MERDERRGSACCGGLLLFLVVLLGACDGGGSVTLSVEVVTDLSPGVEISRVEIIAQVEGDLTRLARTDLRVGSGDTHRVAEWMDLPPNSARAVEARFFGPSGALLGERRLIVANRTSQAITFIFTRSCLDVSCPSDETCLGGTCVDPRCLTGAEPECSGLECDASSCAALSECDAPICRDGVCLHLSASGVCGGATVCVPPEGCVMAPPPSGDAGTSICRPPVGACDYLEQDCAAGDACVPVHGAGSSIVSACMSSGSGVVGRACIAQFDCAPGSVCHDSECTALCCPGEGLATCAAGHRCEPLVDGYVGYCIRDVPCDPLLQTGCVPGLACYERTIGTTECLTPGMGAQGDECFDSQECAPGFRCTGRCRQLCTDTCPDTLRCAMLAGETYHACYPDECDPITQLDCGPGEACYPTSSNVASCTIIVEPAVALGEACVATNQCVLGTTCASNVCRTICRIGGASCSGGATCTAFAGPAPLLYGACIP